MQYVYVYTDIHTYIYIYIYISIFTRPPIQYSLHLHMRAVGFGAEVSGKKARRDRYDLRSQASQAGHADIVRLLLEAASEPASVGASTAARFATLTVTNPDPRADQKVDPH